MPVLRVDDLDQGAAVPQLHVGGGGGRLMGSETDDEGTCGAADGVVVELSLGRSCA
jgi:hypothetical protein